MKKIFTVVAIIAIIAIIILVSEINKLNKKSNSIIENNKVNVEVQDILENDKKELKFDTLVNKVHTAEELENMRESDLRKLLDYQLEFLEENTLEWKKVAGSASNVEEAKIVASDSFKEENQFITKLEIVEENEIYYVVNVKWKNVTQSNTRNYEQKVLVLNKFFYNTETNILNLDDFEKLKFVLDLYNYTKNYNNNKKRILQTFVEKKGKTLEYILYYAEVNYDMDNQENVMNFSKEINYIDAGTGEIFNKNIEVIKSDIVLN